MIGEYFRRSTSNIYEQQTETLKNSKMCSDTTCVMHIRLKEAADIISLHVYMLNDTIMYTLFHLIQTNWYV